MSESDCAPAVIARPGRSCPINYRYGPTVFRREPALTAETLYVIGGLYGNSHALDAIEAMSAQESRHRPVPRLVFNGDFHWFDIDPAVFNEISRRVLQHIALRGNVETELASDNDNGCGCGYPDGVSDEDVDRSNQIMRLLRATACQSPALRQRLGALPMHLVAQVGNARIGIVHGDAESLAGWGFSCERLRDPAGAEALQAKFNDAEVDIFACSHTCLPAFHRTAMGQRQGLVVNNGAAGMPNFLEPRCGVISRIGTTPAPPGLPVLHETALTIDDVPVHVAALGVEYDDESWHVQFQRDWPAGSAAHASYWNRLVNGPAYRISEAYPSPGRNSD